MSDMYQPERDEAALNFAAWMNAELKRRGWNRKDLAAKSGVDYSLISPMVYGRTVYLGRAAAIASVLGLTLDQMIRPWECGTCRGEPPAGYICGACGTGGAQP